MATFGCESVDVHEDDISRKPAHGQQRRQNPSNVGLLAFACAADSYLSFCDMLLGV
jgi:hypothetical protein